MVEFIEKEPFYSPYSKCWMRPIFMVKDGKEFYVFNSRKSDTNSEKKVQEAKKKQLISNNGLYYKIYGSHDNPLDLLKEMAESGYQFIEPGYMFDGELERIGFCDFHGNTKGAMSFSYRIYDKEMIEKIQIIAEFINKEKYAEAIALLN